MISAASGAEALSTALLALGREIENTHGEEARKLLDAAAAALSSSPVPSVDVGGDGNRLPQVPALGAASGWMAITSAPRDGTRILAVEAFKRVSMDEDGNVTREHPEEIEVVFWSEKMGEWVGYGMALVSFEPTRWMPPPALTASPAGDEEKDGLTRVPAPPVEPTEAMLDAGENAANDQHWKWRGLGERKADDGLDGMRFIVQAAYRAMVAVALSPKPNESLEEVALVGTDMAFATIERTITHLNETGEHERAWCLQSAAGSLRAILGLPASGDVPKALDAAALFPEVESEREGGR